MADSNVFSRLKRLFSSNIIVRRTDSGKLAVKDINFSQMSLTSNFIDRYNRIIQTGVGGWGSKFSTTQNARNAFDIGRKELFRDYELMDSDAIISSALDIYSDESTVTNIEGEILNIKTDNSKIYEILHNLFYNIINIEFNLWSWIRNMCKYGDFFLHLHIMDKLGVVTVKPISSYDVVRMEDHDPSNPDLVQFEVQGDDGNFVSSTNKMNLLNDYEIAHFRLFSDANFLPYGKSQLEGARKVWKQLVLMEDAMLVHRIMRAPEKRIFRIDVGNVPPPEVDGFMEKIINKMKKIPVIDQKTGDFNLRYNLESTTEDYWLPIRGSDSGTSIESLPGLTNEGAIDDIEYLRNKLMASLRIPKAFLGYEEGIGSKATLAAEDIRFARTIERIQKIIVSELNKIAMVHLYVQGFTDTELIDFELELVNPSMIHEQEKLELLERQVEIAGRAMEGKLFSQEWIYDNIFDLNEHEKEKMFDGIIEDAKQKFRMEQIEQEGNDPAVTGEKEETEDPGGDWGGSEKGAQYDEIDYGKPKQKDLKSATSYEKEKTGSREFKGGSPLYPGKGATIVKQEGILRELKKKYGKKIKKGGLLNEKSILDDE